MAFGASGFHRVVTGNANVYVYKSADAIATVAASGYFNDKSAEINNGDVIIAIDTNVNTIDVLMVSSADGAATVTTVNGT